MRFACRMRLGGPNTSIARCLCGSASTDFAVSVRSQFRWWNALLSMRRGEQVAGRMSDSLTTTAIHKIRCAINGAMQPKAVSIFSLLFLAALILIPNRGLAQAGAAISNQWILPGGTPAANARLTVCPYTASGVPCSPQAAIYSDIGLTVPLTQPYSADQYGNATVYVTPGSYIVQVQVNGSITYSYAYTTAKGGASGSVIKSVAALQSYTSTQLAALGQVTLSGYNAGSTLGGGNLLWIPSVAVTGTVCTGSSAPYICTFTVANQFGINSLINFAGFTGSMSALAGTTYALQPSVSNLQFQISTSALTPGTYTDTGTAAIVPDHCINFAGSDELTTGAHGVMQRIISDFLYPEMCGATGGGTGDDTLALQYWGETPWKRSGQRTTYIINSTGALTGSGTINVNGELGAVMGINGVIRWGIEAPPGMTIQDNISATVSGNGGAPIMTVYGSRGVWKFPHLTYLNVQTVAVNANAGATTGSIYSAGIMVEPYPGLGGLYMSDDIDFRVDNSAICFDIEKPFYDILSGPVASGSNVLPMRDTPTATDGLYPWMPQEYVQILLDNGTWFIDRIQSISGNNLTLVNALPSAAGNTYFFVVHSTSTQNLPSSPSWNGQPVLGAINDFSNTYTYNECTAPTFIGWWNQGAGTHNIYLNRFIRGANFQANNNFSGYSTIKYPVNESGRSGDKFGISNFEHFTTLGSMWTYVSSDGNVVADSVHIEGIRLVGDSSGMFDWQTNSAWLGAVDISYSGVVGNNQDQSAPFNQPIVYGAGIFKPSPTFKTDASELTSFTGRGIWHIDSLTTIKNIVDSSATDTVLPIAFVTRSTENSTIDVEINTWNSLRDGGWYPAGQLTYPVQGPAPNINNRMPIGTVSYIMRGLWKSTGCQRLYSPIANLNVSKILLGNGSGWNAGSPAGGIFLDSSCTSGNLLTSANNLSALLNAPNQAAVWALASGAQAPMFNMGAIGNNPFYLKMSTGANATTTIGNTQSTYCAGRNGGDGYTNICQLNMATIPLAVSFTGSISGTALTSSAVTGTIKPGDTILSGAAANTHILSGSGTSWVVDVSQTVTSASMTGALLILPGQSVSVSGSTNPALAPIGLASVTGFTGSGYSGNGTVLINGFNNGCDGAQATVTLSSGAFASAVVNVAGVGCLGNPTTAIATCLTATCTTSPQTVTITSTTAAGPIDAYVTDASSVYVLGSVTGASGGSGFSGTGFVTLSNFNNGCNAAVAQATITSGSFTSAVVTNPGNGCTAAPTTATCLSGTATCVVNNSTVNVSATAGIQYSLYVDSPACTYVSSVSGPVADCGTSTVPQPDTGITLTVVPTADIFVIGDKY